MAITKILYMKDCGRAYSGKHLKQAIDYILVDEKTGYGRYVGSLNCQSQFAYEQMRATKVRHGKTDKRQGYHIIISFEEDEVDAETAFEIIGKFVDRYLGTEYEAVYAVHDNTAHVHGHIIFNSVNCCTGRKFRYEKGDWAKYIQPITNQLCAEYGLSTITIENERVRSNEHYKDWNDFRDGKFVWADMIKRDIDACIIQAPTFEVFLDMMREKGYEVKQNKYLAIKPMGMTRFRRCRSFGDDYTEEAIRYRIVTEDLKDYQRRYPQSQMPRIVRVKKGKFYKRARLSGLQKRYYAKLYKAGRLKKKPYSQAWVYRDEIKKMHKYHEQYMFLVRHNIHSFVELMAVCENLEEKRKEVSKERSQLYKERSKFHSLFLKAEQMTALLPGKHSFDAGDKFFREENEKYQRLNEELGKEGYTYDEVEALREHYRVGAVEIREKSKAVSTDYSICKGILYEIKTETDKRVLEMKEEKAVEQNVEKTEQEQRKQPRR